MADKVLFLLSNNCKMQRSGKIFASEILLYYHGEFGISTTALEQNEDKEA